jgi:hypothetical protein
MNSTDNRVAEKSVLWILLSLVAMAERRKSPAVAAPGLSDCQFFMDQRGNQYGRQQAMSRCTTARIAEKWLSTNCGGVSDDRRSPDA